MVTLYTASFKIQKYSTYKCSIETRSCNHCYRGKAVSISYSECVYVALVIEYAKRMRRVIMSSVACLAVHIFQHYFRNGTIFGNILLKIKCVVWFSQHVLHETFLILRRIERDVIKKYIYLHVKYPLFLSDLNETWIFWTDFRKFFKCKISWNSVRWESKLTAGG
jgi:hypothetical protein